MNFSEIKLPGILIADLYKNCLVEINPEKTKKPENAPIPSPEPIVEPAPASHPNSLNYLGKNLANVLILVHYPYEIYLPEQQLNLLIKILEACHLSLADIAIVNTSSQKPDFNQIQKELTPKIMMLFGVMPQSIQLAADLTQFNIEAVEGVSVVCSPELDQLSEDNKLKGKLWQILKQLFNV